MEPNQICHLSLTECFFLSTEFANGLFNRGFNSYTKCMKYMNPIDTCVFDMSFLIMQVHVLHLLPDRHR